MKLLTKLRKLFPCVTVTGNEDTIYLKRWYLLKTRFFSIYLHNIVHDEDADMHDHPWNFVSIILKGGYLEYTPQGSFWRPAGSVIFHKASDQHRIVLKMHYPYCKHCGCALQSFNIQTHTVFFCPIQVCPERNTEVHAKVIPSWSLVFMGSKVREWGFHTPKGWVHFKNYIGKRFVKNCE